MIFQSRTLWSESIRMWSDDPSQEFFFREDLFAFRGPIFWARKGNVLEYLFYIRFEGLHIALRGKERQHFDKRYFPYNTLPETVQHSIMFSWIVMAWRANVHFFFLSWLWGSNHFYVLHGKERQHFDKRYFPYNTLPETVQHSIMFSWIVMAWRANVHFFFLSWLWGSNHF